MDESRDRGALQHNSSSSNGGVASPQDVENGLPWQIAAYAEHGNKVQHTQWINVQEAIEEGHPHCYFVLTTADYEPIEPTTLMTGRELAVLVGAAEHEWRAVIRLGQQLGTASEGCTLKQVLPELDSEPDTEMADDAGMPDVLPAGLIHKPSMSASQLDQPASSSHAVEQQFGEGSAHRSSMQFEAAGSHAMDIATGTEMELAMDVDVPEADMPRPMASTAHGTLNPAEQQLTGQRQEYPDLLPPPVPVPLPAQSENSTESSDLSSDYDYEQVEAKEKPRFEDKLAPKKADDKAGKPMQQDAKQKQRNAVATQPPVGNVKNLSAKAAAATAAAIVKVGSGNKPAAAQAAVKQGPSKAAASKSSSGKIGLSNTGNGKADMASTSTTAASNSTAGKKNASRASTFVADGKNPVATAAVKATPAAGQIPSSQGPLTVAAAQAPWRPAWLGNIQLPSPDDLQVAGDKLPRKSRYIILHAMHSLALKLAGKEAAQSSQRVFLDFRKDPSLERDKQLVTWYVVLWGTVRYRTHDDDCKRYIKEVLREQFHVEL